MKILVVNCGSSSLKADLFDMDGERSLHASHVARIGLPGAAAPDHGVALAVVLDELVADGPLGSLAEIDAVAHRVVHGGTRYRSAVLIDDDVIAQITRLIPLLPLHHPANLAGIRACTAAMPDAAQVAVFDTAFHRTIPDEAAIYGLPYELFRDRGIRKYGFHGHSHEYVAAAAARFLETPQRRLNIVTCHLGNGASVCAVQRGRSIDTSMGFGPLPGLIMGSRVGDLDPGIIPYLAAEDSLDMKQIDHMLNREGGLLGISGVSSDLREIQAAADGGDGRAALAIKAFCYRLKLYIGAYTAAMGGIDVLVFTGGIGEHSRGVRARAVQGLERLGIAIDLGANDACQLTAAAGVVDLSAAHSRCAVLAIATDEERMMARGCAAALDYRRTLQQATDPFPVRVAVSAHHVHLCRADMDALFGEGHQLTVKAPLFIDSQFACQERLTLIGPRGRVERVRVIGPARSATQVEISRTEEFQLGIDAPVRASGDLAGSTGLTLEGPAGSVTLGEGVICAMRHVHMTPDDAAAAGVRNGDQVMVKMDGDRELVFGDVLVRVNPAYRLEMHIDTDEGNAADLPMISQGTLVAIQGRDEPE